MPRSFAPIDLVQLPALDVPSALALGQALETAAQSRGKLPAPIAKARKRLAAGRVALTQSASERLRVTTGDADAQRAADRDLDNAWAALYGLLTAWARLPSASMERKAALAGELTATLFPGGLKFIQLPYKAQWAESTMRLQTIDRDALGRPLRELGAEPFVEAVREAHGVYGEVLGITQARKAPASGPSLREPLLAFIAALRDYALKVAAHADDEDPASVALTDALLGPLVQWKSGPRTAGERAVPAPEPGGGGAEATGGGAA